MRRAGFALPTVVILLALMATSVFLVTRESTTGADRVNRSGDAAAARYAARAGLAHATWIANSSACTGYDLPATAFGPHSYSATFTPAAVSPVGIVVQGTTADGASTTISRQNVPVFEGVQHVLSVQPGAADSKDGWLDATRSGQNFGGDTVLAVQAATGRPIIEFDLSGLPSQARVLDARLELRVLGVPKSGAVSLYRATSSWTAGSCVAAVCADGVTWDTRDGVSAWVKPGGDFDPDAVAAMTVATPDIGNRVSFDVTSVVADWRAGVINFGLFLIASTDAEVNFVASEGGAVDRPSLELTYACECGVACAAAGPGGRDVLLVVGDELNLTPEQVDKKALMESWGHTITLIQTSATLAEIQAAAALVDVVYIPELGEDPMTELGSKADGLSGGVITEEARRALKLGDFALFPFVNSATVEVTDNSHYITETLPLGTVTLSSAVQSMWVLKPTLAVDLHVLAELGSAEPGLAYLEEGELLNESSPAPGRRVKLPWGAYEFDINLFTDDARTIMQRAIEWGASPPTPAKKLLFVVGNDAALTAAETAHQSLIESWGYPVELIDDGASQTEFDTAVSDKDVVFTTNDITASNVGTKLVSATIGVVTSEDNLSDEFGLSASIEWESGTTLDVDDNSHYITSAFPLGPVSFLSSTESLARLSGTLAPDLQQLATQASQPMVVAIEAGGSLYAGGNAAGRRVQLPWGGNGFDPANLTADGETLLQRSLEWGAAAGGGGGGGGGGPSIFGFDTQFATEQANVRRLQIATQVVLLEDGTITSITAYVGGRNRNVRYAIYSDASGEPDVLLAESANTSTAVAMGWVSADVGPTALTTGTYWLALSFDDNQQKYVYEAGGQTRHKNHWATQSGFTPTWDTSDTTLTRSISIYATYTP